MNPIAQMVDKLFLDRQTRLVAQKEVDKLKEAEDSLLKDIMKEMHSVGIPECVGAVAQFKIELDEVPEVEDWTMFQEHIRRTGQLDLLQKRPMVSAIRQRWESGDDVPGIARVETEVPKLSKVK
jgi:hypothetical protein